MRSDVHAGAIVVAPAPLEPRDLVDGRRGLRAFVTYRGLVEIPAMQRIVDTGVRFANAHVTALCAPTRACILTGRNHHTNHMGLLPRWTVGAGSQDAKIPRANGFLSEMLVREGYATYCIGKWHLTTVEEHRASANRSAWPLGCGFERFYGFMGGQSSSYNPHLVLDNGPLYPPKGTIDGYHLSEDLVDTTVRWLHELRSDDLTKPFFVYLSFQASHAPHHAPAEWIDRGYALWFADGRPQFVYNDHGILQTTVGSDEPVSAGRHAVRFVFEKCGDPDTASGRGAPGVGRLYVDEQMVAQQRIDPTAPAMLNFSGMMTCGYHPAEAFDDRHAPPFRFRGRIHRVTVKTHGSSPIDPDVEVETCLRQR